MVTLRGRMKKTGSSAVPKFGGSSGNALQNMMMAQMMLPEKQGIEAQGAVQKQGMLQQASVPQAKQTVEQFGGVIPPDTKFSSTGVSGTYNPKYSVEESTTLGGADSIKRHLDYIRNSTKSDPSFRENFTAATFRIGQGEKGQIAGFPLSTGNKDAIKLAFHLNELGQRLVYLRSGKQINPEEYIKLNRTLPSYTDISDPNDINFDALLEKINSYETDMNDIKNRLIQGGNYDVNYWEGPIKNIQGSQQSTNVSPIPGMQSQANGKQDNSSKIQAIKDRYKVRNGKGS